MTNPLSPEPAPVRAELIERLEEAASALDEAQDFLSGAEDVDDVNFSEQSRYIEGAKAVREAIAALSGDKQIVALERERDQLWAELSAVSGAIGSVRFMDHPDGGDVSLSEQVRRMRVEFEGAEAELARLKAGTEGAWVVIRKVTRAECGWLDADIPAGTVVYRYTGVTYGCIGPQGIAVSAEPDTNPFFELPRDALATLTRST